MREDIEWTDEMGEISGFGGSYETACRKMVMRAATWLRAHEDADPTFGEIEGVFGISDAFNDDAKQAREEMVKAAKDVSGNAGGPTGAMIHACTQHVVYISEYGWDEYKRQMESKE